MALAAYISAVQTLLHDPNAQFYPTATLTSFINEARQQIALEGECIRGLGAVNTAIGQQLIQNSSATVPTIPLGIEKLITPRDILYDPASINGSLTTLESRNWEWFSFYWLGFAAPPAGVPAAWAPREIGKGGSFYIGPKPDQVYPLQVDGVWVPIDLAADADPEAIPYPWTDAIQFYTLFLAYTDSQRKSDAAEAFGVYEQMMQRARGIVTPLRDQRTFPGGLTVRTPPGMAPPTLPAAPGGRR